MFPDSYFFRIIYLLRVSIKCIFIYVLVRSQTPAPSPPAGGVGAATRGTVYGEQTGPNAPVRRDYLFTVTVLHNLFFIGNLSQFLLIQYRVENGKYNHMELYSTNHRRVAPTWGVAFPWGPLYTIH